MKNSVRVLTGSTSHAQEDLLKRRNEWTIDRGICRVEGTSGDSETPRTSTVGSHCFPVPKGRKVGNTSAGAQ